MMTDILIVEFAVRHRKTMVVNRSRDYLDAKNSASLDSNLEVVERTITRWVPTTRPHHSPSCPDDDGYSCNIHRPHGSESVA